MKEQERYSVKPALPAMLLGTLLVLSACGGGSGGTSSVPSAPAISETQLTYESFALASNGGLFDLEGSLDIDTTASGTEALNPASTFFTEQISIPKSPSGGAQPLTDTVASVASTLTAPTSPAITRYMVGGTVYSAAFPSTGKVTYPPGGDVQTDYYASGSTQIVYSTLSTSYTVTLLTGLIAASPSELLNGSDVGLITNTVNGEPLYKPGAAWQAHSAYIKVVRQVSGDTLVVSDCAAPVTTGPNPTPCASDVTTLESFFPYVSPVDGSTYQIGDGQIVNSLAGVRAWVANTPVASAATPVYLVFYQGTGGIYAGLLLKNGTTLQEFPAGSTTPQSFRILLNAAAVNSIKAAITF
jgi:hypothetical protein